MVSIVQIKNKLPMDFIEEIYSTYNQRISDKILMGIDSKRLTTLRVNTLKYDINNLTRYFDKVNIEYDKVLWYDDALIIKNANESELQQLDIYKNGYIYIQSLSSMIPPLVLNPREGENILDLTAAPGSKTTQMACMMHNKGYILANELNKIRCEKLKYNVNMQGAEIVEITNKDGTELNYKEKFDKVLLDTPCSGEGRFILEDENTYKTWSIKQVNELAKLQKKLIKSGVDSLKNGGEIVYSTCTLNKKENEEIVDWAIKNLKLELLDIDLKIKDSIKILNKAMQILPNETQEGFFIAKLRKI